MAYDIFLEHDDKILRVRYSGQVDIEERRAAAERVFGRSKFDHVNRFLLDYRNATFLAADPESSRKTAQFLADKVRGRNARVAWLVTYDHQLGPHVEQLAREFGVVSLRFQNLDAAVAWLEQDEETEPPDDEVMGGAMDPAVPSVPRRALALAMEASDPRRPMPPVQFAALAKLVQELLDEGMDEAKALSLAKRMVECCMGIGPPRPASSSTRRG